MAPLVDLSSRAIAMQSELVILCLYLLNANTQYQVNSKYILIHQGPQYYCVCNTLLKYFYSPALNKMFISFFSQLYNQSRPPNVTLLKQSTVDIFWNWFKFEWCFCVILMQSSEGEQFTFLLRIFNIWCPKAGKNFHQNQTKVSKTIISLLILIYVLHQSRKVRR